MSATASSLASTRLLIDEVDPNAIVAATGTPCYVYAASAIRSAYRGIDEAFGDQPHAIHYALKASSTLAIARLLRSLGSRADANSIGEVDVALRAGFTPDEIVFTGVGKSVAELERGVELGLLTINVESPGELDRLDRIARARGTVARVALRVNPDIDARSHPHISTGLRSNKFGVPIEAAPELFREIARRAGLQANGVHVHIGSQITSLDALVGAAQAAVSLAAALRAEGIAIQHVDFGGGLGISYDGNTVPNPTDYVRRLVDLVGPTGLQAIVEPGRTIVGPAGYLLTRVVDVKHFESTPTRELRALGTPAGGRRFVVLDAGMTELMRPALYGAFHAIEAVQPRTGAREIADIVGPICESTDTFARDRALSPVEPGDLIAIRDVGAYGAAMASNYLRRPLSPEVLADAGTWTVIRRRQTLDDLLGLEA